MTEQENPTDSVEEKLSNGNPNECSDYIATSKGVRCWHIDRMPYTDEIAKKAVLELNERPEQTDEVIDAFRIMIKEKAKFTSRMDDIFLLRYLRVRKFNMRRAYKLLKNYYKSLKKHPDIFGNPRPSAMKDIMFLNSLYILPYRDPEGRAIAVIRIGDLELQKLTFNQIVLIGGISLESAIDNPVTQVAGIVVILDFKNVTPKILATVLTPTVLHTLFVLLQNCLPGRLKDKHVVNGTKTFQIVFEAIKAFMNKKMKKRFTFHEDMASLHKHLPPEILPEEYGGTLQFDRDAWSNRLVSEEAKFVEAVSYGYVC